MKKQIFILILTGLILLSFSYSASGQENTTSGNKIKWSGYLQTDNRLRLKDSDFSWEEYRLDLKAEVSPSEKAHFYSELWIRSWGFSELQNSSDLINKDKVSPWNLDLREAYVDLYEFLLDNLDVRVGRQRIAWGTGDKLNPTDNLNPADLEDIWDFGRHLGSNGLKMSYYLGDYTFEAVFIPAFTPTVLPRGDWASALSPSMELPPGLTLRNLADTIIMPKNSIKESLTVGVRVLKNLFNYDFSLSYVHGNDFFPLAEKIIFTPTGMPGEVDIASELIYPKRHIVGADMAGTISDVGIWAEVAVFFPEKIMMTTDLSALGMDVHESIALDDKPYMKYIVGADYTFENGIYINGQYLHGFIHERGKNNLEDYFMFGIEKKLFEDKLKITIFGGMAIKDFKEVENNYALILSPEIVYYPVDNAEIILGVRWIEGKEITTFGKVKDNDELFVRVKYSF